MLLVCHANIQLKSAPRLASKHAAYEVSWGTETLAVCFMNDLYAMNEYNEVKE